LNDEEGVKDKSNKKVKK